VEECKPLGAGLILTGAGQGITQQATALLNSLKVSRCSFTLSNPR